MPIENSVGKSRETSVKEQQYHQLFNVMAKICRGLGERPNRFPFGKVLVFHIDLTAGPGRYPTTDGSRYHTGSPISYLIAARENGITPTVRLFEKDPANAAQLRKEIEPFGGDVQVIEGDHNATCDAAIRELEAICAAKPDHYIFGFVVADPNGTELPIEVMARFLKIGGRMNRMEGLCYVSSTNYKRWRRQNEKAIREKPTLQAALAKLGRSYLLVRKGAGKHGWTFVIATNWKGYPEFTKQGYHLVGTPEGDEVMRELNLTVEERRSSVGPKVHTAPMPSTCDTQRSGPSGRLLWSGRDGLASIVDRAKQLRFTI